MSRTFVILLLLYQTDAVERWCRVSNCFPANCTDNHCERCYEGYFLRDSWCQSCRWHCSKCYSDTNCSECKSGYYGLQCQNACTGCKNCSQDSGACLTECVTGFYKTNTGQCSDCGNNCDTCENGYTCSSCANGYYKQLNDYNWVVCNRCSLRCARCTNNDACSECYFNYWGSACQYDCLNCQNKCDKNSGCSTKCKYGFYGQFNNSKGGTECLACPDTCTKCTSANICQSCKMNLWGRYCQYSCQGCWGNCEKAAGCSSGCTDRYFPSSVPSGTVCQKCPYDCETCVSLSNCSRCRTGFSGLTCQHDCRHCNGQLCNGDTGYCTFNCTSSQYFDVSTPSCRNCPAGCRSCISSTYCYACTAGQWGHVCEKKCSLNCKNGKCNKNDGVCTSGCNNGYFGDNCTSPCLPGCESCSSGTRCTTCKINHFHKDNKYKCDCSMEQCSVRDGENCSKCLTGGWFTKSNGCCPCSEDCKNNDCFLNGTCVDCTNKRYGDYCERTCRAKCNNRLCYRDGTCVSCVDGTYGSKCNRYCSNAIGYCKRCHGRDVSSVICTRCSYYRYADGKTCRQCNYNCKQSACNGSTGTCTYGCKDDWFGDKCDSHCNVSNCYTCPNDKNVCTKCNDGYYRRTNLECIKCPANCKTGTFCNEFNGNCNNGCLPGWSGEKCDIRCPDSCKTCDQTNTSLCDVCNGSLYGYQCELNCGTNCRYSLNEPTCSINNGSCTNGCEDKYWGSVCDKDCGIGCSGTTCDRSNGVCLSGCNFGYYGSMCNSKCSGNCAAEEDSVSNRTCNEVNGTCLYGCVDGLYGDTCKSVCSKQCNRTICDSRNGTCLFGCIDGYIGSRCNKAKSSAIVDSSGVVAVGVGTGIGVAVILIAATLIIAFILRKSRRSSTKLDENNSSGNVVECSQAKSNEYGPLYRNIADVGSLRLEGDRYDSSNIVYANATVRMSDVSIDEGQTGQTYETLGNVDEDLFKEEKPIDKEPTLQKAIHVESLDDTYYNVDGKRVTVHNLQEYVRNKSHFELLEEFEKIPKGLLKDYKDAKKSDNAVKNKYRSIYPYDDSRVVLYDGGSDYMNASYITGCNKPKEYIASSGPFKKTYDTTPDFWRMVWQEKCENIVMLTNPVEGEERKCEVYWPEPGASKHFGDLHVTCLTEDRYSDFTIRTLTASQNSESLNIRHLHFTAWPDKGVPHDVTSMIEFGQKVRSLHKNKDCPMLVHCSAGIGRTGTFIALDMLTYEGESRGSVDIFSCVACLRSQRCNMVQTVDQYEYLHHAVLHSLTFDCRSIAAVDFQQHYARLIKEKSGVRPIDGQFQQLQAIVDELQDDVRDEINRNKALRDKNRDGADIPEDSYRVKLHSSRKPGASDYINAVFINGLRARQKFIVAQTPLPTTIVDFLTLIHQTKCSCVVMMEEADIKNKTMGVYWPADNQTSKHGIFKVSRKEAKSTRFYTRKTLSVVYHGPEGEEEHEVHFFIFTNWPRDSLVPKSPNSLLQFVKDVDTINRRGGNSPILIHCMTGSERSCLYCAVSNLVEKMEIEQEVSVVNTLRQIKARRLLAFPTIEQYMFCHEALISYLQTFETYSNFALQDSEA